MTLVFTMVVWMHGGLMIQALEIIVGGENVECRQWVRMSPGVYLCPHTSRPISVWARGGSRALIMEWVPCFSSKWNWSLQNLGSRSSPISGRSHSPWCPGSGLWSLPSDVGSPADGHKMESDCESQVFQILTI